MKSEVGAMKDNNEANAAEPRLRQIILIIGVGTFMAALDASVVNIALPSISKYYGEPLYIIEWVIMSYLLIISSLLLTYGRLGDMYGHKKVYIGGFAVFSLGSLMCSLAPSILALILSRMAQALGAGMIMSMGPAIITDFAPPQSRGKALGVNATAVAVASATGPVAGGFLTTHFGWQSIFYINIPIGIIGTILAYKVIPETCKREIQTFDLKGAAAVFFALISILLPLSNIEKYGWNNVYIVTSIFLGLLLLLLFVHIERTVEFPMVDLKLFQNRLFTMSNLSALINYMSQFSLMFLMPFYLQQLKGLPPSKAGMMLIPMPIVMMIVAPISGALSDRFDVRYISTTGMGLISAGIFLLSRLRLDSSDFYIMAVLALTGLGSGLFQTPNNSAIMGSVPGNRRGIASGMLATMRNIGMVLGVAVSGAIFSSRRNYLETTLASGSQAFLGALSFTFTVAALLAAVAVLTSMARGTSRQE